MIEFTVKKKGPVFDERGAHAVERFTDDATRAVAEAGARMVRMTLNARIRVNTGYYVSHVISEVRGSWGRVWDQFIIYGRWLEGTGSRNRTTRFKGYHSFRDTAIRLDQQSEQILAPLVAKLMRELNGGF